MLKNLMEEMGIKTDRWHSLKSNEAFNKPMIIGEICKKIDLLENKFDKLETKLWENDYKEKCKVFFKHDVDIEKDILEFFGKSRTEMLKNLYTAGNENIIKQQLFKNATEIDRASLHRLYEHSDYITIPLSKIGNKMFTQLADMSPKDHFIWRLAVNKYPDPRGIKVIDHGCGPAHYGIKLALMGYDVTLMDLPHKAFRFLQFLVEKYDIPNISFKDITPNEREVDGMYDYIISSEVLEHCEEPVDVLRHLRDHLKINGWMYLGTFFNDLGGIDPSHLKKNNKYQNFDLWIGIVARLGLMPMIKDQAGVEKGFQRISQKLEQK